ncbi:MAG: LysE family transporter [Psychrilyobacter sp.]|nr:LysE family transporter [Psychrilyobacter sp.]
MYLLYGIICGLVLSLPFGPLAIYCMEKTLSEGRYKGFVSALGMITVDIFYGMVALFGFRYVEKFLESYQIEIKIISGFLILGLGYKIFRTSKKIKNIIEDDSFGYIKSYITTILVAFANPLSIFTFIGLFALLGVSTNLHEIHYISMKLALGILIGGGLQWFGITSGLSYFRKNITLQTLETLRHYASILIMVGGIAITLSVFV